MTRAHSMILVGERRPEEGHDPVAHDPVHGAFVVVHCCNHALKHRVDELLCLLWIAVGNLLRRILDVSEQNGNPLSFALEACLGSENPVGEMLWRVILGRGKARFARNKLQRMAAFGTELGYGRDLAPTVGTAWCQTCRTLLTELGCGGGFVLALETLHHRPSAGHGLEAEGKNVATVAISSKARSALRSQLCSRCQLNLPEARRPR